MQDAIPAATVIIFREKPDRQPELLMVERAKTMAFAGGAMVFPGGRIDPGDHAIAARLSGAPADAAARIAAIRETIEEAGLPIGLAPMPPDATLSAMRDALHAGVSFVDLLDRHAMSLALDLLVPFARWRPAHEHMRIFDTHFYLTRLPAEAPPPRVDETENVRLIWTSAADVLDAADRDEARIIFPTRRNLERLAQFGSYAEALSHARRYPLRTITPWIEHREGVEHLCIDGDLGYPVTAEPLQRSDRA